MPKVVNLSIAELLCIKEALDYAKIQIRDSNIIVFEGIAHREEDGRLFQYNEEETQQGIAIADDLIKTLMEIIEHDEGIIYIDG